MKTPNVLAENEDGFRRAFLSNLDVWDFVDKLFYQTRFPMALLASDGRIVVANNSYLSIVQRYPRLLELPNKVNETGGFDPLAMEPSEKRIALGLDVFLVTQIPIDVKANGSRWLLSVEALNAAPNDTSWDMHLVSQLFLDNAFVIIFKTLEDGRLIYGNLLFKQSLGIEASIQNNVNAADTIFCDNEIFSRIKQVVSSRGLIAHESVRLIRADGTSLIGLANCMLNEQRDGSKIFTWAVLDISDAVEYETRLKQKNDQLAKVNQQMEKFLYCTSHDLRAPLTTILGLVNLLRMEVKDRVVLDYAGKIESSAVKLDKIVHDIMTFSRTTYQRVRSERIDLELLIWKVLDAHQDELVLRGIHFEVKVTGESLFFTDPERAETILDNVIRNSIQFFDSRKSRPYIQINVKVTTENSQIDVIDNGIGIGRQHLPSIFNLFYKASYNARGAGLGLFVVKEAVTQLHGTIWVESEIGLGSRFSITVPNDQKGRLINRKLLLQQFRT